MPLDQTSFKMNRLEAITGHLTVSKRSATPCVVPCETSAAGASAAGAVAGTSWVPARAPLQDDVVVVCAKRTPIGKAKRGSFKVRIVIQ